MSKQSLSFKKVTPSAAEFDIVLDILQASFPPIETRSRSEQIAVAKHPDYNLCLVLDGARPVGVVGYWQMPQMLYLENFCVAPELRNGGYGGAIVSMLANLAYRNPFVLEAELPTDDLARRRIGFYKRNGMVENAYPHIQAHLRAGDPDLSLLVLSYKQPLSENEYAEFRKYLNDNVDIR